MDEELTGGLALDTGILVSLAKGSASEGPYDSLFPESKPLTILTAPKAAPTLEYAGTNDVNLQVRELGLDFVAELDHRQSRIVQIDIAMDAGADLLLDKATGEIAIAANISGFERAKGVPTPLRTRFGVRRSSCRQDAEVIVVAHTPTVTANEFAEGYAEQIEGGIGDLFDSLVGPIIDGLLGDLAIQLPSMYGLGLASLEIAAAGDEEDWLGAHATLGEVPYESSGGFSGCGEEGCGGGEDGDSCASCTSDDSGCTTDESGSCTVGDESCDQWEGGCSDGGGCTHMHISNQMRGRIALMLMPLMLVLRRREESSGRVARRRPESHHGRPSLTA